MAGCRVRKSGIARDRHMSVVVIGAATRSVPLGVA